MTNPQQSRIILFDGVCNFCSASVQFVIKRDSKQTFQFCALQSNVGKQLLEQQGLQNYALQNNHLSSMILLEPEKALTKSSAALTIAKYLDWPWPLLYGFIIVPRMIRDAVYDFIGKRRYQWFGKRDSCWIPPPAQRKRFLDHNSSDNNNIEVNNE